MGRLQLKPIFVKTRNVRAFETMMGGLALAEGEGRLGLVHGRAGRGKSRTAQWFVAHNDGLYLRILSVWRTSELEFLRALCRELGMKMPPYRKGQCMAEAIEALLQDPKPIFLDEPEKMPQSFLGLILDLAEMTASAVVCIGEEEIAGWMRQNRRVWSRTFHHVEFAPITMTDISDYAREATGVNLPRPVAAILNRASGGDFRLVRRGLLNLVHIANSKGDGELTEEMAEVAVQVALKAE